ncbi:MULTISPECIES: hypothetical protein [Pseudoalteromonas]|nr:MULTISPECIES: hypothetical protein [Pseudoalteromonas]
MNESIWFIPGLAGVGTIVFFTSIYLVIKHSLIKIILKNNKTDI